LQTPKLTLVRLVLVLVGALVCLAAVIYLAGLGYLVSPAYWRLDVWDREAVRLLARAKYKNRYRITSAGVELITVPNPGVSAMVFDPRGEEILGTGPRLWYELCRGLPKGLAEDWVRRLSGAGVTYLSRGDRLFIWGPELKKCRRVLGRELREQWVSILDEPDAAELARYVDDLERSDIESRVSGDELCVLRKARVDALEVLVLPPLWDAYWMAARLPEAPEKLDAFRKFLDERGFEFLEYPGRRRPGGLYVRGVWTPPSVRDNEICKAVSAKLDQLREQLNHRSVTESP